MWGRDKKEEAIHEQRQQGDTVERSRQDSRVFQEQEEANRQRGRAFPERPPGTAGIEGGAGQSGLIRSLDNVRISNYALRAELRKLGDVFKAGTAEISRADISGLGGRAGTAGEVMPGAGRVTRAARERLEVPAARLPPGVLPGRTMEEFFKSLAEDWEKRNPGKPLPELKAEHALQAYRENLAKIVDFDREQASITKARAVGTARRERYRRRRRRRRHMDAYRARVARFRGFRGRMFGRRGVGGAVGSMMMGGRGGLIGLGRMALGGLLGALSTPASLAVGGMLLPAGLGMLSGALMERNRPSATVNAGIAGAFASFDVHEYMRSVNFARQTEKTTTNLIAAQDAARASLQPFDVVSRNLANTFGTFTARTSGAMARYLSPYYTTINDLVGGEGGQSVAQRSGILGVGAAAFMEGAGWGAAAGGTVGLLGGPGGSFALGGLTAFFAGSFNALWAMGEELITGKEGEKAKKMEADAKEAAIELGRRQAKFMTIPGGMRSPQPQFRPAK